MRITVLSSELYHEVLGNNGARTFVLQILSLYFSGPWKVSGTVRPVMVILIRSSEQLYASNIAASGVGLTPLGLATRAGCLQYLTSRRTYFLCGILTTRKWNWMTTLAI